MKTATLLNTQICSCPNQFLLAHGEVCELCMGFVHHEQDVASQMPKHHLHGGDIFDEFYFEELETYYEDIEFAA